MPGYLIDDGLNRDSLAQAVADIATLQSRPYPVAHGRIHTDGAGGFSVSELVGCTAAFNGIAIRITFDTDRPEPVRYSPSASRAANANEFFAFSNLTKSSFDMHLRDDGGTAISLATTAVFLTFSVNDSD